MTEISNLENFEDVLANLGLPALNRALGLSVANGLYDLGLKVNRRSLAEIIVKTQGLDCIRNKALRIDLVKSSSALAFLDWDETEKEEFVKGRARTIDCFWKGLEIDVPAKTIDIDNWSNKLCEPERFPFPYQNWVRSDVRERLEQSPIARMLIHMPTGAGKTMTAMSIIIDHFRKIAPEPVSVVWLAHTNELCEQAAREFERNWENQGVLPVRVHKLWGKNAEFLDVDKQQHNFFVTSFQSANSYLRSSKREAFEAIFKVGRLSKLVIVDEAHLATAPTFRATIEALAGTNAAILGLSATPGRHSVSGSDEQTLELHSFFDNNIIKFPDNSGQPAENPIRFLQEIGTLSKVELHKISGSNAELSDEELKICEQQLELPDDVIRRIAEDKDRTVIVAGIATKEARNGKKIIVFCPSKDNSIVTAEYLKLNGVKAAAVTGDMPLNLRQSYINQYSAGDLQVITNFNVLTTGFDEPSIDCVIVARPTLSVVLYAQMLGRGMRGKNAGGTSNCSAFIIEDNIKNLPSIDNASTFFTEETFS